MGVLVKVKPATTKEIQKLVEYLQYLELDYRWYQQHLLIESISDAQLDKLKEARTVLHSIVDIQKLKNFYLASRDFQLKQTAIRIKEQSLFQSGELNLIAGPCSVENQNQMMETAAFLKSLGIMCMRGGSFKPRSSPYSFQGHGLKGLSWMKKAADYYGLYVISEVMETSFIDAMESYVDIFQVGSRNMQNFSLLKALGKVSKPVILKRGFGATYNDLLMSAEYILSGGNPQVILCERGIRTFESMTRNTLDLNAIPVLKELSHLPVIVDPSHGTGASRWVAPMAKAALACGADGLMIEVHPQPSLSISDPQQALSFKAFEKLYRELQALHEVLNKKAETLEPMLCV